MKCNKNFQSKFAYIDGISIPIDQYITTYLNNNIKCNIKCLHNHDLVCANGKIRAPYFRHKNDEDMCGIPMTDWHSEWQSNFLITEQEFLKVNELQIKNRRCDIHIPNHNLIVEIQHSKIDQTEVKNRKNDYSLHNQEIVWVIDGSNIKINKLEYCNRYYLDFTTEWWKYRSFIDYEYIYIDIDGHIYKIYPQDVKCNMIDVDESISKEVFIRYLMENNPYIKEIKKPEQCNLYVKQQGAGNGKTYGLIQMLESKEFEHYKYFIIVTKQHSAKYVIYSELKSQCDNGDLKHINITMNCDENNKYKIGYKNTKTGNNCQLVIGTIDSLMHTLGDRNHKDLDKFAGYVNSIVDGYLINNNNSICYSGINMKLNKEVCLICDETQDLTIDYAKAIIQIMRNKYIDTYIVGDKLQSLKNEINTFTYFMDNDFSYIKKHMYEPTNICRRFYHPKLINFVNSVIPFQKYNLASITPYKNLNDYDNPLIVFSGKRMYQDTTNEDTLAPEVEKIMSYYIKEVEDNNYNPNDFLIVTPFVQKNPLVNAVETAINMYWNNKIKNDTYERFAVFHKSEEGTSINLSESENATRIVSIHASKGDGRPIVFVLGINEKALLRYCNKSDNLIYDSLLHVAFTRMKKKLYIRYDDDSDDISQRIINYSYEYSTSIPIEPSIKISKIVKYSKIVSTLHNNEDFKMIKSNIIDESTFLSPLNDCDDTKLIIDMGHHNIRYTSMLILFYIKIIMNENNLKSESKKKQFQAIFYGLINTNINKCYKWQDYYNNVIKNKYNNDKDKIKKDRNIPILNLSSNGREYTKYFNILDVFIKNIQMKMKYIIDCKIDNLCPFECIILYYMIQITDLNIYSDITMSELYNIIDIYSKSFSNNITGHDNCLCKKYFNDSEIIEKNNKVKEMNEYLLTHYENIEKIGKIYDTFLQEYPSVNWLTNKNITYTGNNNDFELYHTINLIGYDDTCVYIVYIKPQLSSLNYNYILIDSIFDSFIIKNIKNIKKTDSNSEDPKKDNKIFEDYIKFANKNIKSIVFSLNSNTYHTFEWKHENEDLIELHKNTLTEKIKDKLFMEYVNQSKYVYNYYKYWKEIFSKEINTPEKIIKNIILKYKNKVIKNSNDNTPHFIIKFLESIEYNIKFHKHSKNQILNKYDDKEYFMQELHEIINDELNDYLGITDDDTSSDD